MTNSTHTTNRTDDANYFLNTHSTHTIHLWIDRIVVDPCKVQGWPWRGLRGAEPLIHQSILQRMAFSDGAKAVIALEKAVLRHAGISAKTTHIAHAAGDSARKLLEMIEPIEALEKAWTLAIAKRDAFTPAWDRAFAKLKLAARAAEDAGHEGIFAALFDRPASPKKKASGKRKAPAKPEEAPKSVQTPVSVPGS